MESNKEDSADSDLSELVGILSGADPEMLKMIQALMQMSHDGKILPADDEETKGHLLGMRMYPDLENQLSQYSGRLQDPASGVYTVPLNFILSLVVPQWVISLSGKHDLEYVTNTIAKKFNTQTKQKKSYNFHCVPTGSKTQGLCRPMSVSRKHENLVGSRDLDLMFVQDDDLELCVGLDYTSTYPGYVRLLHSTDFCTCRLAPVLDEQELDDYLRSDVFLRLNDGDKHTSRSFTRIVRADGDVVLKEMHCHINITQTGPSRAASGMINENRDIKVDIDEVSAFHYPAWPKLLAGWYERKGTSGWPSKYLKNDIVSEGCHFVPVAHKSSERPEIEWRFSLVEAERKLALSFTSKQRQCYLIFKVLVSYTIGPKDIVSTFCLKNIMFWAMEKLPGHTWEDELQGISTCIFFLLDELIHCLACHNLPHYFIPQNNLLEGKLPEWTRYVARQLLRLRKDPVKACLDYDRYATTVHFHCIDENYFQQPADLAMSKQWRYNFWQTRFDTELLLALTFAMRCYSDDFEGICLTNERLRESLLQHDLPNENIHLQCGLSWCYLILFIKHNEYGPKRERAVHFLKDGIEKIQGPVKICHLVYYASYLLYNGLSEEAATVLKRALSFAKFQLPNEEFVSIDFYSNAVPIISVLMPNLQLQFHLGPLSLDPLVITIYLLVKYYMNVDKRQNAEELVPLIESRFGSSHRRTDHEIELLHGVYLTMGNTDKASQLVENRITW